MRITMKRSSMLLMSCLSVLLVVPVVASQQRAGGRGPAPAASLSAETRQKLMESLNSAAAYLKLQQQPNGFWDANPGVSAVAAAALLRQTGVDQAKRLENVGKALDSIAAMAKPDGGIYDKAIPHYITAVSVMALAAAGRPQDKPLIEKGRAYLADHLWDEGEGIPVTDKWYGGIGYGGSNPDRRADIISLEYALRAMKEAELPANDAAWQKAIVFLQRTQNNSEVNRQEWAKNDGGFVYYPGFSYSSEGATASYGSATYAGVMSYVWANVKKDDDRVKARAQMGARQLHRRREPGHGPEDRVLLLHGVCQGAASGWRTGDRGRQRAQPQLAGGSRQEAALAAAQGRLLGEHGGQGRAPGQQGPGHRVHDAGDRGGAPVGALRMTIDPVAPGPSDVEAINAHASTLMKRGIRLLDATEPNAVSGRVGLLRSGARVAPGPAD